MKQLIIQRSRVSYGLYRWYVFCTPSSLTIHTGVQKTCQRWREWVGYVGLQVDSLFSEEQENDNHWEYRKKKASQMNSEALNRKTDLFTSILVLHFILWYFLNINEYIFLKLLTFNIILSAEHWRLGFVLKSGSVVHNRKIQNRGGDLFTTVKDPHQPAIMKRLILEYQNLTRKFTFGGLCQLWKSLAKT